MATAFELWFARVQFGFPARVKCYQELAALLRSGMPKADAVALLAHVASNEGRKPDEPVALVLGQIVRGMRNGLAFGEAVRNWVPDDDRMMLEATENSDDFPQQLEAYCITMRKKKKIISTIVTGLAYPVMLFLMIYGMLVYFGRVVVPGMGAILDPALWVGAAGFLAFLGRFAEIYAGPFFVVVTVFLGLVLVALPRLRGRWRIFLDRLPIFSLYRLYTGISFMFAISALMRGGVPPIAAIERILPLSNAYVRERLTMVRRGMLNGLDFGEALHATGTRWPDHDMTLSIKIFARTAGLSGQLAQLALDWLDLKQEQIEARMAITRSLAFVAVFAVIMAVVLGMYSLQSQIANAVMS